MLSLNDKSPSQMGPRTIRWELVSKLGKGKFENQSCCQTNYQVKKMKRILEDKVVSLNDKLRSPSTREEKRKGDESKWQIT